MKRQLNSGCAVVLALLAFACTGNTDAQGGTGGGTEEDDLRGAVERSLMAQGIPFDTLSIDESVGEVTIDGDMVVDLAGLLGGEGGASDLAAGSRLQGYYAGVLTDSKGQPIIGSHTTASPIRIGFAPGVSAAWQTAFAEAIAQWNPNPCIEFSIGGNTNLEVRNEAFGGACTYADATLPTKITKQPIRPGTRIRLNTNYSCGRPNIEALSPQLKRQVAMHELGHIIGFMHRGAGVHINGTLSGSYSTVMEANFSEPGLGALTADDIDARDTVFRSRVFKGSIQCL